MPEGEAVVAPAQAARPPVFSRLRSLLLVTLATVCWSTSGFFVTEVIGNSDLTAVSLAFWRDLAVFLVLLGGIALVRPNLLRVNRRDLPWLAAMGAISIGFFHVAWNSAVLLIGASVTTVFQGNSPLVVAIFAYLLWREPLTAHKWAAILLGVAGTVLIAGVIGPGGDSAAGNIHITPTGFLLGLAVAGAYSMLTLLGKKLVGSYNSWTVMVYMFGFASLALLPLQFGAPLPAALPAAALLPFAGLVLFTSIGGFGLYTLGLRGLAASTAAIVGLAEIPFAAILAYLLLGERLTVAQMIGAALVAAGVIVISRRH